MTRAEVLKMITPKAPVYPKIVESDAKKFLILQGDTQVNGFIWVIQSIVKHQGYKRSDVIAVAPMMSVFGIA